jgi:hypothetical protein
MELCSEGHPEVCHNEKGCPVCQVLGEIADLGAVRDNLIETVRELKGELLSKEGE